MDLDAENECSTRTCWIKGLDTAVQQWKWDEVNAIIKLQPRENLFVLKNYMIGNLPVLHCLAGQRLKEDDVPKVEKFVQLLKDEGYQINQTTDSYRAQKRASLGFTALLAAVEKSNLRLIDLLISNGADPNIRDKSGFSACHWTVLVGNLTCLHRLISHGADVKTTDEEKLGHFIHPVLHTAVDEGRTEIVYYLMQKNLVDINEQALYRGILSENSFTQFPSRYNCVGYNLSTNTNEQLEVTDIYCTPLGRAVRMRKISIIEILLKHSATLSGLDEWHFCILEGDTEVACLLAKYIPNQELEIDQISGKWALHCLHSVAFQDENRTQFTTQIIQKYVDANWDINSVSIDVAKKIDFQFSNVSRSEIVPVVGCSLLHMVCISGNLSIVKFVVEKGANVNQFTAVTDGEGALLNALHMSLLSKNWDIVMFLMEHGADVNLAGRTKRSESEYTSLELLLKFGDDTSLDALNVMLEKKVVWNRSNYEFHAAIHGGNPLFVSKVFECVKDKLSLNDLCWVNDRNPAAASLRFPTFTFLLQSHTEMNSLKLSTLANLLQSFVRYGYNCNTVEVEDGTPLIFHILDMDLKMRSTRLLETLLKFDHLRINVQNINGQLPIDYLLSKCNQLCLAGEKCWKTMEPFNYYCKAVKMLVNHGADVSSLVIGEEMKYHYGYLEMLQVLYCAGAKIGPSFFRSGICHPGFSSTRLFKAELDELQDWVNENSMRISLEILSRLRVRQHIQTIGDLKVLLAELPKKIKEEMFMQ